MARTRIALNLSRHFGSTTFQFNLLHGHHSDGKIELLRLTSASRERPLKSGNAFLTPLAGRLDLLIPNQVLRIFEFQGEREKGKYSTFKGFQNLPKFLTSPLFCCGGPTCLPSDPCGTDGHLSSGDILIITLLMAPFVAVFGPLIIRVVRRILAAKS